MASKQDGYRQSTKDWSASQYLKFSNQRTRPARDLLAQISTKDARVVLDIGCGPGNSTQTLVDHYPNARVVGMDSSPDMIAKAKTTLPNVEFVLGDLRTYAPDEPVDVMFSNAVYQWIRHEDRISIFKRLIQDHIHPGGVFAFQVPDNRMEGSHVAMREVAADGPWAELLTKLKPGLDPFQTPQQLYDELIPLCSSVDIWHTMYQHPLENHEGIVEWVKGTGLRPFIDPLSAEDRGGFLAKYLEKLKALYPSSADGKVLLRYPRLFLVAKRS